MKDLLRYPIGQFDFNKTFTAEKSQHWIMGTKELPIKRQSVVQGLSPEQLDTPNC